MSFKVLGYALINGAAPGGDLRQWAKDRDLEWVRGQIESGDWVWMIDTFGRDLPEMPVSLDPSHLFPVHALFRD